MQRRPPSGADQLNRPSLALGRFAFWARHGALCSALVGCARSAPPSEAPSAAQPAAPARPLDRTLTAALGGAETCFNATDDNDNGLLDEGCDVRQGDVHFMIAWSDPSVDVDLFVVDPSGSLAGTEAPSALGLVLSDDCPRAGGACTGQPFESVHLDDEDVGVGTYHVRVVVQSAPGTHLVRPLPVRFGARVPGLTIGREFEFSESAREVDLTFVVAGPQSEKPPHD